jgi:phospholipid/cholesterol/gamma-HCH transport system substrate-binding protein
MSDRIKNTLIGFFLLVAVGIVVTMILFLKPHVGDGEKVYNVRFSNISGISKGTRVTFAGRPVGLVTDITEVKDAREGPTDGDGRVFFYQLTLKVDSSVQIYASDEISIQTAGLLGEKAIAILPKSPPKGTKPQLISTNKIIYADSQDPIENIVSEVTKLSSKIEAAVSDFNSWFLENEDNMSIAIKNFGCAMGEIDCTMKDVKSEGIVEKSSKSLDLFQDNLNLVYCTLTDLQQNCTIEKFTNTIDNINEVAQSFNTDGRAVLKNMNEITYDISHGRGSLGKLVHSDDLYLQVQSLLSKGQTLVNDVNHYGLLFQYDKSWQRKRVKRANLLNALKTPKEFQSYFEQEVDGIQTSLTRLTTLMEKAQCEKEKIISCKAFQKDFRRLLNQINTLSSSIKTYNEDLVDLSREANQKCR